MQQLMAQQRVVSSALPAPQQQPGAMPGAPLVSDSPTPSFPHQPPMWPVPGQQPSMQQAGAAQRQPSPLPPAVPFPAGGLLPAGIQGQWQPPQSGGAPSPQQFQQ